MFYFLGKGPPSKSLLLRALIAQSYAPDLLIKGQTAAQDVYRMKQGLKKISSQKPGPIDCGAGGAVLRFLAVRAARAGGDFKLTGSRRLFERPMKGLISLLRQLGSHAEVQHHTLTVKSSGWRLAGDSLTVQTTASSQFASAVFLNSWNFNKDIFISLEGQLVSYSYLQMTVSFLRSIGMTIQGEGREWVIPARQTLQKKSYTIEPDMSSLFAVSACAWAGGRVIWNPWPAQSLQPDFIFPFILEKMGFVINLENNILKIESPKRLKSINWNVKNTPDMFPVLAALCALANGESRLDGGEVLRFKESNRLSQTAHLLRLTGTSVKILKNGLLITGRGGQKINIQKTVCFDPKEDHRLAFAAAVLKQAFFSLKILNPDVVKKSFPSFWTLTGIKP